uniref:Transcriptional regulator, TetR family n=1 Tax=Caulobacter sp. (strain K31) TaxID=366602 RepID=B0T949_CAUSK
MTQQTERLAAARHGGPSEIREQIIIAASEHFSRYGYAKTTVADLAKAIGFSKAYIYKFFDSKQAIGEAICGQCLAQISDAAQAAADQGTTATEKYRKFFKTIVDLSVDLFFNDRKLYDIAAHSFSEKWAPSTAYMERIYGMLREIILFGRETREFERKTPLDETCRVILQVMNPLTNPLMLEHNLDVIPEAPNEVSNLVLRSLAP